MTDTTRNKKVARSYESIGVDFDPSTPAAAAKGFTSTNAQDAIVEAKQTPASDIWDSNDNGAVSPSNLNEWATERFFKIQHKEAPGVNGGSVNPGEWAERKFTEVNTPIEYQPNILGVYPSLITNTNRFILPGPAVYNISGWSLGRYARHQMRIDIGTPSSDLTIHKDGTIRYAAPNNEKIFINYSYLSTNISTTNWKRTVPASSPDGLIDIEVPNGSHTYNGDVSHTNPLERIIVISATNDAGEITDSSLYYVHSVTVGFPNDTLHCESNIDFISGSKSGDITWVNLKDAPSHGLSEGDTIFIVSGSNTQTGKVRQVFDVSSIGFYYSDFSSGNPGDITIKKLGKTIIGSSEDPAASVSTKSTINEIVEVATSSSEFYVYHYFNGNGAGTADMGRDSLSGLPNIYAEIICERIA